MASQVRVERKDSKDAAWDWPLQHGSDGIVKVHNDNEKFEVSLDAQHFAPKEIQVKVIGQLVDVALEHAARKDDLGDVSRTVARTYHLPDDVDPTTLKSTLTARGTLVLTASKKK